MKRPSRWPIVIGTISAILGGGGVLSAAWQLIQSYMLDWMMGGFPGQEAVVQVQREWRGVMGAVLVPGIMLAVALLVGGVLLLRRRPAARPVLIAWAGVRVIQGLALAVITGMMQGEHMEAAMSSMGNQPGAAAAAAPFMGSGMAAFTMVIVAAWTLVWPLVLLIWLSRGAVRAEVRGWAARRAAPAGRIAGPAGSTPAA